MPLCSIRRRPEIDDPDRLELPGPHFIAVADRPWLGFEVLLKLHQLAVPGAAVRLELPQFFLRLLTLLVGREIERELCRRLLVAHRLAHSVDLPLKQRPHSLGLAPAVLSELGLCRR